MKKTGIAYEMKQIEIDPFDIMCGECQEHYIEWWKPVTEEELREEHEYDVDMDNSIPEFQKQIMIEEGTYSVTEKDFNKWLAQCIAEGYIRKVEEDKA